jgi:DNA-binding GntR family transcriptional regulator
VVVRWDAKTIDDLFDARLSLEVGAARYAARQVSRGGSMDALNVALKEAQRMVEDGDAYAIARSSTAFHEAVVETSTNELMARLMQTISGRITWLFYLTSGLPAEEAFHDHVLLRDAIASGNDRVAESVAYAHIERDRQPTFEAMREQLGEG